jgi:hypothetical protein
LKTEETNTNESTNTYMKTNRFLALTLIAFALTFAGCAALDKAYKQEVVYSPPSTNVVTKYITNTVEVAAVTNADNTVTPPKTQVIVVPTIETVITPARYTTNLVDNPAVTGTIAVAETLPIPFVGLAGGVIGLLYSVYRNIRNKKALVAVVQGIDDGRKLLQGTPELQAIDAKIRDVLIQHQEVAGVLNAVSDVVNKYTNDTVPPKA